MAKYFTTTLNMQTGENGSQETTANGSATTFSPDLAYWETHAFIFQAINIALLTVTTWILLCMVVYGTKTGRWTKGARASSLSNGIVFTTSVVAIALSLPRLIACEVMYNIHRMENWKSWCEVAGDIGTAGYCISLYGSYFFLCVRQRLIYTHPYVKEKVGKCMDIFSRAIFYILTAVAIGLLCIFIIPLTYPVYSGWCYENREGYTSVILGAVFIVTQTMILCLCIYPACRVSLGGSQTGIDGAIEGGKAGIEGEMNYGSSSSATFTQCCKFLSEVATSPVEMSIKRTILCSVLIVISDIVALLVETLVLAKETPVAVRQTIVDIGSFVNIFCILGTFGFAGNVLTLFFPKCKRFEKGRTATDESIGSMADNNTQI